MHSDVLFREVQAVQSLRTDPSFVSLPCAEKRRLAEEKAPTLAQRCPALVQKASNEDFGEREWSILRTMGSGLHALAQGANAYQTDVHVGTHLAKLFAPPPK